MRRTSPIPQFDFGKNWCSFSQHALDNQRVEEAGKCFDELCAGLDLNGKVFLDIGFGQGLGLLNAANRGALSVGCDINAKCAEALDSNRRFFPQIQTTIPIVIGSILDDNVVEQLRSHSATREFDIVHSWGVLHHTGDMRRAIGNAASLVGPSGHLIIAIYKRHWSSPIWKLIKRTYVDCPSWVQSLLVTILSPVIVIAKFFVTGRNPFRQGRGMDFHFDVIDWVGGYPYEYASAAEIATIVTQLGFTLLRSNAAKVPTGCNEFIFLRRASIGHPGEGLS